MQYKIYHNAYLQLYFINVLYNLSYIQYILIFFHYCGF